MKDMDNTFFDNTLLEDIITKEECLTIGDFKYITRPDLTEEEKNCIKTISVYLHGLMPGFDAAAKNKIDYLRPLIEDGDFMAIEDFYVRARSNIMTKDPSIAKFNMIFALMLWSAANNKEV